MSFLRLPIDRTGPRPLRSWISIFVVLVMSTVGGASLALADTVDEYDLKAAFLLNFADYVEWPPAAGLGPASPLRMCTVGSDRLAARIDRLLRARALSKRPVISHRMNVASAATNCHIVFLDRSSAAATRRRLSHLSEGYALTVGEGKSFAEAGGIIGLEMAQGRVKLIVNLPAARRHELKISSRLLALAQVIQ